MSELSPAVPSVNISVRLAVPVTSPGRVAFSVVLAEHLVATESLTVVGGAGQQIDVDLVPLPHGTRMHVVDAPQGELAIHYEAASFRFGPVEQPVTPQDRLVYLRPSRYCPADRLTGFAAAEFGGLNGPARVVQGITDWINDAVAYVPGATDAGDDALHPLLTRQGVCRDFAHLGVTLCRALGIAARYVSVYAPGLDPMEAHAVFEAEVDGRWRMFDATRLAPRTSMVRIATGRDAADAALLSPLGALLDAPELDITVTAQPDLPYDNGVDQVTLG